MASLPDRASNVMSSDAGLHVITQANRLTGFGSRVFVLRGGAAHVDGVLSRQVPLVDVDKGNA